MDRALDPSLQRILDDANGFELPDTSGLAGGTQFDYSQWTFGPAPRPQPQDSAYFRDSNPQTFNYHAAQQPEFSFNTRSTRLSLAPRSILNPLDGEQRTLTNAENRFRFAQNLRQGLPIKDPISRMNTTQQQSPISQLASNMVMQKPMQVPRDLDEFEHASNFVWGLHTSSFGQLQPQKQQVTPPFNLSGFSLSRHRHDANKFQSFPSNAQYSSPSTGVTLRRAARHMEPLHSIPDADFEFEENMSSNRTPEHLGATNTKYSPQTLFLAHAPPIAHGIQLVSPQSLSDEFRRVFPYELFNAVQSKCFGPLFQSNDNIVVSAPTGSGKTVLLELAICRLVEGHSSGEFKIVYQAPTKSLCSERMRDWQKKFSHLNLFCAELTGDTSSAEMSKVRNASIIVTTPEKWDSITRKWKDHDKLLQMVKLFLIDEVHILKELRGATLEAVVSRMKSSSASHVRFVALSATVPNSKDIAVWLGKDHNNPDLPAHLETFGEDFRPVRLQKHVHGYDGPANDFAFERVLDGKLPTLIQKYTHKKPVMVFCFTRKSCEGTAAMLAEWWTQQSVVDRAWPAPTQPTVVANNELKKLTACGVAFHHAGLDTQDRHAIEASFLKGEIGLICCTSTLAVGVNLPCHLVVLKGTVGYQGGSPTECSDLEVMQMLGRAGRPQFDDSAVAIIMTRHDKVDRYKKMISGQDILESTLHLNLLEHLNSEVALGSIRDLHSAKCWLSRTFLAVRMRQNPTYYKLSGVNAGGSTDKRLELACERDIKLLQENNLIAGVEKFSCTEYGEAMSRYLVEFETMKLLLSIPSKANKEQILTTICQAKEFSSMRMKPTERTCLRILNQNPFIKFPIHENVSTTAHKISLIIQIQLGGIDLAVGKEYALVRRQLAMVKNVIFDRANRLVRCIIDCKAVDCDAISMRHAFDLARSISAGYWESSNLQLRQIPNLGPVAHGKFVEANINSVEKLGSLDTATIERVLSKNPPFGRKMQDVLVGFPRLTLASAIVGKNLIRSGKKPTVNVRADLGFSNTKVPIWNSKKPSVTFTAETTDGVLVYFWRGNIQMLEEGFVLKFIAELSNPDDEIKCCLACEEIVGTLRSNVITLKLPALAFPPLTKEKDKVVTVRKLSKISCVGDSDEFGGDDIDDDVMIAAANGVEIPAGDYDSDQFVDIDELGKGSLDDNKTEEASHDVMESVQMENGKWTCNHRCRDGQLLKNGQLCKHRCCLEGLDKPRKIKRKPSISSSGPASTQNSKDQSKMNNKPKDGRLNFKPTAKAIQERPVKSLAAAPVGLRKSKPEARGLGAKPTGKKQAKREAPLHVSGDEVEVVDLAEELSPMPYFSIAHRDYRKLYSLHTNVQTNKAVRLPKQKPQFSYGTGGNPDLPFLRKAGDHDDQHGSERSSGEDDFPSPSILVQNFQDSMDTLDLDSYAFDGDTITKTSPLADGELLRSRAATPKVTSSFANGVFDFAAYKDPVFAQDSYSSPLMRAKSSREEHGKISLTFTTVEDSPSDSTTVNFAKRTRTPSPELPQIKYRRVERVEGDPKCSEPALPEWLNEVDPFILEGLIGFVDFVD